MRRFIIISSIVVASAILTAQIGSNSGPSLLHSGLTSLVNVVGTLAAANGGTGQSSYAVGDILSADTTTSLSKISAVASGRILSSAGTNTLPTWNAFPQLLGGGLNGGTLYHLPGTLYFQFFNTGNAADTNFITTTAFNLLGNTLPNNGDRLYIDVECSLGAFGSTKTYILNIGYSSFSAASGFTGGVNVLSHATATSGGQIISRAFIERQSPTLAVVGDQSDVSGSFQDGLSVSTSVTWGSNNNIAFIAKDGSSNANAITIRSIRIKYDPAP